MQVTRVSLKIAAALLAAVYGIGTASSQEYPAHRVRIIVPYSPGAQMDTVARLMADGLSNKWGQAVFVENIPGAGGDVGSGDVFRSDPDGYTLLVTSPGSVTNQFVNKNPAWTPSQWSPISVLATTPYLLDTRLQFDGATLKDLIAQAHAKPNSITYASGGVGSSAHLAAVQLETLTGIKMVHVPYRGAAPALNDLMAGRVDVDFDAVITTLPLWRDGKVNVLGVTSKTRSHLLPDLPTLAESGVPGFEAMSWTAMIAPPATPPSIVQKIFSGVRDVLSEPSVIERLQVLNLDAVGSNPAETAAYLVSEGMRWDKIVGKAGISPE